MPKQFGDGLVAPDMVAAGDRRKFVVCNGDHADSEISEPERGLGGLPRRLKPNYGIDLVTLQALAQFRRTRFILFKKDHCRREPAQAQFAPDFDKEHPVSLHRYESGKRRRQADQAADAKTPIITETLKKGARTAHSS